MAIQLDYTIQSKIMAMVFALVTEIERDLISKITKETLQTKKLVELNLEAPSTGKVNLISIKLK